MEPKTSAGSKVSCALAAFTLCKENLETLEAISYMAAALGVLPSDFTYAGIKDKRAVTYQSMVVKKVSPQRYFWVSYAGFHCRVDVELETISC